MVPALLLACACTDRRQPETLAAYRNAVTSLRRGDLAHAEALSKRGAAPFAGRTGSEWYWRFRLLDAEILLARGQAADALRLLDQTPTDKGGFADLEPRRQMDRGNALFKLGQMDASASMLDQVRSAAAARNLTDVLLETEVLQGSVFSAEGKLDAAESVLRSALQRARAANERYYEAAALNNLGFNRMRRFRYDEAVPLLQQALIAGERVDAQRFTAVILGNLALCSYRLGDFEKALDYRRGAIAWQERSGALGGLQASLGEMGNIYQLQGDAASAIPYFERALALARKIHALADASKWAANLATVYAERGDWDAAERSNRDARALKEEARDRASLVYVTLNAAMIAAGRGQSAQAEKLYRAAAAAAAGNPAVLWESHAGLASLYVRTGRPREANGEFERAIAVIEKTRAGLLRSDYRMTFLSRLIRFYQEYVDALVSQGRSGRALEVADSSRARVLAERLGPADAPSKPIAAAGLRSAVSRAGVVALSYWLAPRRSFLWVVSTAGIRLYTLAPEAQIARALESYQGAIDALRDPLASDLPAGRRLYQILLRPAEASLRRDARVVVVPDGPLHAFNLETLPVYEPRPHYWIEDALVTVAPSLSLAFCCPAAAAHRTGEVLVIGDPQPATPGFPSLPNARAEIRSIERLFPAAAKALYTGARARPAAYREAAPGRFSIIHFAAHAVGNRDNPLDSAVILAPGDRGSKLYARDVLDTHLDAALVTLSACRGAGARAYSGEGLVGLAWAFLHAGARNVIAGLWDVSDKSTADLMQRLYTEIAAGRTPAEALRLAKLALVRSGQAWSKPYYWAPFQTYTRTPPAR